jgi:hypothetical protein
MEAYNSVLDAKVNMLVGLGFSPKLAREALDASKGNVDDAIEFLIAAKGQQSKEQKEGVSSHAGNSDPGPELTPNQAKPSTSQTSEKKKDGTSESHRRHGSNGHSYSSRHSNGDSHRHHDRDHRSRRDDSPLPEPALPARPSFPGAYRESNGHFPNDDYNEYDVEANRFNRDTNISSGSNTDSDEELIEAYVVRDDRQQQAPPPVVRRAPAPPAQPEEREAQKEPKDAKEPQPQNFGNRIINFGDTNSSAQSNSSVGHHDHDCWLVTTNRYSLICCTVLWLVIIICVLVGALTAKTTTDPVTGEQVAEPNAFTYIAAFAILIVSVWACICCCYRCDCDYWYGQSQSQAQSQSQSMNVVGPEIHINNYNNNSS